jgi:magnesium-transporting ATPase (P-type)
MRHNGTASSGQTATDWLITPSQLRSVVQAAMADDSQADDAACAALAEVAALVQMRGDSSPHELQPQARQLLEGVPDVPDAPAPFTSNGALTAAPAWATPADPAGPRQFNEGQLRPAAAQLLQLPVVLASALRSDLAHGLSGDAADLAARAAAFGSNCLAAAATSSFWQLLLEAASDSTILLLLAAGTVSLSLAAATGKEAADFIDGAAILASVAICVTVTAVTNYQKESKFRQLNSLKENIPVSEKPSTSGQ